MLLDDSIVQFETDYLLARPNFWVMETSFAIYENVVGATHNVKIQFSATNNRTVGLRKVRLLLWRIS